MWVAGPAAGGVMARLGRRRREDRTARRRRPAPVRERRLRRRALQPVVRARQPQQAQRRASTCARPEGKVLALELIDGADVFLSNLRLSALERLGLDWATLEARNPRLVYAVITGYGTEGDERDRPAYDIGAFWARSGLAHLLTPPEPADAPPPFQRGGMGDHTRRDGHAPEPSPPPCSPASARAGARWCRRRCCAIGMYTIGWDVNTTLRTGVAIGRSDRQRFTIPTILSYRAGDGRWFWLIGLEAERHWPTARPRVRPPRVGRARPRLRHAGGPGPARRGAGGGHRRRVRHPQPSTSGPRCSTARACGGRPSRPSTSSSSIRRRWASGGFVEVPRPDGGSVVAVASPVDFHGTPWAPRWMAPDAGSHTDEVLAELGRDDQDIAQLRATGVVA